MDKPNSSTDKERIVSLKIIFADNSCLSWDKKPPIDDIRHHVIFWIHFIKWIHVKKDLPAFTVRWKDPDKKGQTTIYRKDIKFFEITEVLANV